MFFRRPVRAAQEIVVAEPMTDKQMAVQAMLTEYTSLRQETLSAITNRVTIANFTFAAVAVILAALISHPSPEVITGVIAACFVPQVAKVGLMIWLGEYSRSQRAGKYIAHLEERINAQLSMDRAMAWETRLLGNSIHMSYPYLSVILLLLGAGWVGILHGATVLIQVLLDASDVLWLRVAAIALGALLLIGWEILFVKIFREKWKTLRKDYSKDGPDLWLV